MVQDEVRWGRSQEEFFDIVRERPALGAYVIGLASRFQRLAKEAERASPAGTDDTVRRCCVLIGEACELLVATIRQRVPRAADIVISEAEELAIIEAIPNCPAARHVIANLTADVDLPVGSALHSVDGDARLRRALNALLIASRETKLMLGLEL